MAFTGLDELMDPLAIDPTFGLANLASGATQRTAGRQLARRVGPAKVRTGGDDRRIKDLTVAEFSELISGRGPSYGLASGGQQRPPTPTERVNMRRRANRIGVPGQSGRLNEMLRQRARSEGARTTPKGGAVLLRPARETQGGVNWGNNTYALGTPEEVEEEERRRQLEALGEHSPGLFGPTAYDMAGEGRVDPGTVNRAIGVPGYIPSPRRSGRRSINAGVVDREGNVTQKPTSPLANVSKGAGLGFDAGEVLALREAMGRRQREQERRERDEILGYVGSLKEAYA